MSTRRASDQLRKRAKKFAPDGIPQKAFHQALTKALRRHGETKLARPFNPTGFGGPHHD